MKIIEDKSNYEVVVDGKRIMGSISAEKKCIKCNNSLILSSKYDAFFCAYCNEWLEAKCSDSMCEFCKERPDKPLE